MIKYNTRTGDKVTNEHARNQRDVILKPTLRGMNCRKCGVDTEISFHSGQFGGATPIIDACCPEFEQRIKDKLGIQS